MIRTTVAVSGGFDPLHVGHVKLMKEAKKLGTKLVVILNNDNWLMKKKGFVFMPQADRKIIIESLWFVDEVIVTKHKKGDEDYSVCNSLREIMPDIFANGGDRKPFNVLEVDLCKELGIDMKYNVGGGKLRSSSELVERAKVRLSLWASLLSLSLFL